MGAWGHGSFENDDALDWVIDLEESTDTSAIVEALNAVTDDTEDYMQAPACSMAIAAAEVVAALDGHGPSSLPDGVIEWLKDKPKPEAGLKAKALQVIEAILTDSELKGIYEENAEHLPQWTADLEQLKTRLSR